MQRLNEDSAQSGVLGVRGEEVLPPQCGSGARAVVLSRPAAGAAAVARGLPTDRRPACPMPTDRCPACPLPGAQPA